MEAWRGSLLHKASIFELAFTINEAGEVNEPERTTHTSANPSLSCTSISELLSKSAVMLMAAKIIFITTTLYPVPMECSYETHRFERQKH